MSQALINGFQSHKHLILEREHLASSRFKEDCIRLKKGLIYGGQSIHDRNESVFTRLLFAPLEPDFSPEGRESLLTEIRDQVNDQFTHFLDEHLAEYSYRKDSTIRRIRTFFSEKAFEYLDTAKFPGSETLRSCTLMIPSSEYLLRQTDNDVPQIKAAHSRDSYEDNQRLSCFATYYIYPTYVKADIRSLYSEIPERTI